MLLLLVVPLSQVLSKAVVLVPSLPPDEVGPTGRWGTVEVGVGSEVLVVILQREGVVGFVVGVRLTIAAKDSGMSVLSVSDPGGDPGEILPFSS